MIVPVLREVTFAEVWLFQFYVK